jgi:MFS family permease
MHAPDKVGAQAWLTVGLLWMTGGLNYLDRVMITTMRGSLTDAIPMTDAQFGFLTTMFLIVYAILSPVAGFLADRHQRSRVIALSLGIWSLCTWLTASARTYDQLLVTRAFMGVSEAFYMPAAAALVVDYHRGSTRSLASGLLLSGAMVGSAFGGLGGLLAEHHTWAYPFRLFGLLGVILAVLMFWLLRDPIRDRTVGETNFPPRLGDALLTLFQRPSFILLLVYACLGGAVSWAVVGWMPTYIKEQFNLTQGTAGLSTTLYLNLAGMLGMLVGGAWADRWSRRNEYARINVATIGVFLAAPAILLTATTPVLALALAGLVGFGFTRYFADSNMMPIICQAIDPRYRATSWGVMTFFSCAAGALGVYVGGLLRDANVDMRLVFQVAAADTLICAVILFVVRRGLKYRSRTGGPESTELATAMAEGAKPGAEG